VAAVAHGFQKRFSHNDWRINMKKFIPMMLVLMLAACLSAMAQTTPASGQSAPTAGQTNPASAQTEPSAGQSTPTSDKTTSITGCISESGGKYLITDKGHPSGVQLMSSDDLKAHVGHKVRVSGTLDASAGSSQAAGAQTGDTSSAVLKVSNMKMISEHCEASK